MSSALRVPYLSSAIWYKEHVIFPFSFIYSIIPIMYVYFQRDINWNYTGGVAQRFLFIWQEK
jgi:hypothetical protein